MNISKKKMSLVCLVSVQALFLTLPLSAKEVAKVNGRVISDKDMMLALANFNDAQRSSILKDQTFRRQILAGMIDQEVLAQEAEKLKLDQDPAFKEAVNLFKKQYLTGQVLEKKLSGQLTTPALKRYYEAHKDQFSTEQVKVQHILVHSEVEAKRIHALASDPKNDFQELAEKHSQDASAKNNRGEIGFITHGQMVPEFTETAFHTPVGKVSAPIHTIYGYHVIKVVDRKAGKAFGFDEVEFQVRNALKQELAKTYVGQLKKQASVQIDEEAINRF